MLSEKRKKFNGKSYRVSDLKEGPRKKKLVKNLMKARRDVKTALDKKDKHSNVKRVIVCINLKLS